MKESQIKCFIEDYFEIILKVIFILVMLIFGSITTYITAYSNVKEVTVEIKDKYIKKYDDKDIYMVVDTNNNTYQITDLIFIFKFNSTDIYNSLETGKKYQIITSGIRSRVLSKYPNINSAELIDK